MPKTTITLTTLYEVLQSLNGKFENLNAKFETFETVQGGMAVRLISVEQKLEEHSLILRSLQERTEALSGLVDKLQVNFERLDQEYTMITAALRRLEQRFDRLEAERLSERIAALEARMSVLESR